MVSIDELLNVALLEHLLVVAAALNGSASLDDLSHLLESLEVAGVVAIEEIGVVPHELQILQFLDLLPPSLNGLHFLARFGLGFGSNYASLGVHLLGIIFC